MTPPECTRLGSVHLQEVDLTGLGLDGLRGVDLERAVAALEGSIVASLASDPTTSQDVRLALTQHPSEPFRYLLATSARDAQERATLSFDESDAVRSALVLFPDAALDAHFSLRFLRSYPRGQALVEEALAGFERADVKALDRTDTSLAALVAVLTELGPDPQ